MTALTTQLFVPLCSFGPFRYNSRLGGADSRCCVLKKEKACRAPRLTGLARCLRGGGGTFAGVGGGKNPSLRVWVNGAGVNVDDVGMASSYALMASSIFLVLTH